MNAFPEFFISLCDEWTETKGSLNTLWKVVETPRLAERPNLIEFKVAEYKDKNEKVGILKSLENFSPKTSFFG